VTISDPGDLRLKHRPCNTEIVIAIENLRGFTSETSQRHISRQSNWYYTIIRL